MWVVPLYTFVLLHFPFLRKMGRGGRGGVIARIFFGTLFDAFLLLRIRPFFFLLVFLSVEHTPRKKKLAPVRITVGGMI